MGTARRPPSSLGGQKPLTITERERRSYPEHVTFIFRHNQKHNFTKHILSLDCFYKTGVCCLHKTGSYHSAGKHDRVFPPFRRFIFSSKHSHLMSKMTGIRNSYVEIFKKFA